MHSLIYGCRKIAFSKNAPKIVGSRMFKHYKSSAFKIDLDKWLSIQCVTGDLMTPANALWNQFRDIFNHLADIHAPIRLRRVRSNYAPWITERVKNAMNHRDYLKKRTVMTSSVDYDEAYRKARNYVNKLVKNTKTRYHQESIDKTNSNTKQMWKHINQLIGRGSKTTNIQCKKSR